MEGGRSNLNTGIDTLFQALALLKDDEGFQRNYGSLPETISNRRETSISVLCDMLARMKRESDSKKKCADLLQEVLKWWRILVAGRQEMAEKVADLEKERDQLKLKVKDLENEVQRCNQQKRMRDELEERQDKRNKVHDDNCNLQGRMDLTTEDGDSSEAIGNDSTTFRNNGKCPNDERSFHPLNISPDESSTEMDNFELSRFEIRSGADMNRSDNAFDTQSEFSQTNCTYAPLASNPYERLDSTYYNPTQFFQRQSSTFKQVRGRGSRGGKGSRGGGRKKAATPGSEQSNKKQRGGKSQAMRGKKSEITASKINADDSNDNLESCIDLAGDPDEDAEMGKGVDEDDSTRTNAIPQASPSDRCYFDYNTSFVDDAESYA